MFSKHACVSLKSFSVNLCKDSKCLFVEDVEAAGAVADEEVVALEAVEVVDAEDLA